jgi:hypothetical protein
VACGDKAGETLDTFEAAVDTLELQSKADQPSITRLASLLAEGIAFTHCTGHAGAPPSAPPPRFVGAPPGPARLEGKAAVLDYLKSDQLMRTKGKVRGVQPAALMADGRTRVNFELLVAGGTDRERMQDVLEWDGEGRISSWVRVFMPRLSQRDWLQLISSGRNGALGDLIDPSIRFASIDGNEPSVYSGAAATLEALKLMVPRMAGRIDHIGRTREVVDWVWPAELQAVGGEARAVAPRRGPPLPTSTVQAIFIGTWRPLGAKWYGEQAVAMRETAEWRGRSITRMVWEVLPPNHPQAQPVWRRLRAKRARAAQAARRPKLAAGEGDLANGSRPPWSFAQPPLTSTTKNGLKTAKDKEPNTLPPPPKTLPPPTKTKK